MQTLHGEGRGTTTSEKLRGTKVWVSKAGLGVGCGRESPPSAARVRGYHPRKIFDNSDTKSCILVTNCCEIFCFLKNMAKKLGDQYIVGPQPKIGGTSLPRSLRLLCLWVKAAVQVVEILIALHTAFSPAVAWKFVHI